METREQKTITKTEEVVVSRTCDICKEPMPLCLWVGESQVELKISRGDMDGGGTASEFDVCIECWHEKALPWMATFSAVPRETDW